MKKRGWLNTFSGNRVYTLRNAQNSLLQVLLKKFTIIKDGHGITLHVKFDEKSPAIRQREAKNTIRGQMPGYPKQVKEISEKIESVFFGNAKSYQFKSQDFAFRFASGGTLPIISIDGQEYYCFFYRDIDPVGWNIANGACDSYSELRNPKLAIERELREELIIYDLRTEPYKDYIFSWKNQKTIEVPEFRDVRNLWNKILFLEGGLSGGFEKVGVAVEWADLGPDNLVLDFDGYANPQGGFYLNINAEDFGIEFDRIGKIKLNSGLVLLDGEMNNNRLLKRPIGLFEVEKTQEAVFDGTLTFLPDRLFYDGSLVANSSLRSTKIFTRKILEKYFKYLVENGIRKPKEIQNWRNLVQGKPPNPQFNLCPVTRKIIRRHMHTERHLIFICYSHDDRELAEKIHSAMELKGIKAWRDLREIPAGKDGDSVIQKAIEDCTHVIFLASPRSVQSSYIKNELQYASDLGKGGVVLMLEACEGIPLSVVRWPIIYFKNRFSKGLVEMFLTISSSNSR